MHIWYILIAQSLISVYHNLQQKKLSILFLFFYVSLVGNGNLFWFFVCVHILNTKHVIHVSSTNN